MAVFSLFDWRAALVALLGTLFCPLDPGALARYAGSVYLGLGPLSHQEFERQTRRLAQVLPQAEIEVYKGLHHLNPAHLAESALMAEFLLRAWSKPGEVPAAHR